MKKAVLSLFVFCYLIFAGALLFAQQKYALVIGNANYTGISKLTNPVNDANDMETALKGLGFTVDKVLNGNLEQMENAVLNLKRRLGASRNSYGFFFYAGHGVQSNGENYLIPIAADNIRSENQLRDRAVSLQFVLDTMSEAGNELNMIVLDACRDNPFGWARSGSRGLTVVSHAPTGSIVMYATGANSTAADGTGRNGLFTGYLLNNLKNPALSVFDVFDRTMDAVIKGTNGRQHPELSLRFAGATSAYLGPRPSPTPSPSPSPAPSPTPQPSPTPTPQPSPSPVQPVTPPVNPQPVTGSMVRINGGTFTMGSPATEANRDSDEVQHSVTVSSFYMGKYPVTQKEYQEVMGTNPSNFKGDNLPVEQVSWFDAVNYCNRLSQREGLTPAYTVNGTNVTWNSNANGYRLPTEAEWEYACRAGTTTPFSTGNNITTNQANYNGNYPYNNNAKGTYRQKTTAVGSFAPNPWGLYDMHGNLYEWCWDRYGAYSSNAQTDPRGASSGSNRVMRGGGWGFSAHDLRSAYRSKIDPSSRAYSIGFRVVRNAQ
jgi:formylglycine-generating enzyme required for sulfatase activity